MNKNLIEFLSEAKLLPIIRTKDAGKAIDISKALADAGVKIVEVNVESPEIYGAIAEISSFMHVCAGGIITSLQAQSAISVGADAFSSPIFYNNLVKISQAAKVPFIAGASTPNEAYTMWQARVPLIKLYPISAMGGADYLKNILRPMPFLKLLPQGNVKLNEVSSYLDAGAVAVGVGRDIYQGFSYSEITTRVRIVLRELKG